MDYWEVYLTTFLGGVIGGVLGHWSGRASEYIAWREFLGKQGIHISRTWFGRSVVWGQGRVEE